MCLISIHQYLRLFFDLSGALNYKLSPENSRFEPAAPCQHWCFDLQRVPQGEKLRRFNLKVVPSSRFSLFFFRMFEHVYCKADQKQKNDSGWLCNSNPGSCPPGSHQLLTAVLSSGAPFSYHSCDEGRAPSLRTGGADQQTLLLFRFPETTPGDNDVTITMWLDGSEWSSTGSGVTGAATGQGINQYNAIKPAHRREMKELQDKSKQVTWRRWGSMTLPSFWRWFNLGSIIDVILIWKNRCWWSQVLPRSVVKSWRFNDLCPCCGRSVAVDLSYFRGLIDSSSSTDQEVIISWSHGAQNLGPHISGKYERGRRRSVLMTLDAVRQMNFIINVTPSWRGSESPLQLRPLVKVASGVDVHTCRRHLEVSLTSHFLFVQHTPGLVNAFYMHANNTVNKADLLLKYCRDLDATAKLIDCCNVFWVRNQCRFPMVQKYQSNQIWSIHLIANSNCHQDIVNFWFTSW